jgi:glycosyltransferase involved in cell wall biosynthesis
MNGEINNKRAAIFCHDDPLALLGSQETGGQAVYVNSLIKGLDKKGWAIDTFTRLDSSHKKTISMIGKRSRLIRLKGGPVKYISRKLLFDYLPEVYENFLNFICYQNPYLLFHGHYWDGGWLALKASEKFNKPFIENFHSLGKIRLQMKQQYGSINVNGKDIFDRRFLIEDKIIKKSALIISLSESEKSFLQQQYNAFSEKIMVIPGGVDLKLFRPKNRVEARKKLNIGENDFVLLFTGRLEWRKGVGTFIHAAQLLRENIPQLKVLIIGGKIYGRQKNIDDFTEYQRLLKIAKDKKIEDIVIFLGCIDRNRLPLYYSAANIFIIPSYYEPFGLVTLESMACKTPVIASEVGGLINIIRDKENGLLFKPRNPADLKDKVMQLYNSADLLNKITENAYQNVIKNYSWTNVVQKVCEIYENLSNTTK